MIMMHEHHYTTWVGKGPFACTNTGALCRIDSMDNGQIEGRPIQIVTNVSSAFGRNVRFRFSSICSTCHAFNVFGSLAIKYCIYCFSQSDLKSNVLKNRAFLAVSVMFRLHKCKAIGIT